MRRGLWGACVIVLAAGAYAMALQQAGGASSTLGVAPPSQKIQEGSSFRVDVNVSGVNNLGAWELGIEYDPSLIEFESFEPKNFLGATGRHVSCPQPAIDASQGRVQVGCGTIGSAPAPSGSGTVGQLTFTALSSGVTDLDFFRAALSNPEGDDCCGNFGLGPAAVRVLGPGEDGDLPPTPVLSASQLTPTAPENAPTQDPDYVLGPDDRTESNDDDDEDSSTRGASANTSNGSTGNTTGPGSPSSGAAATSASGSGAPGASSGADGAASSSDAANPGGAQSGTPFPIAGSGPGAGGSENPWIPWIVASLVLGFVTVMVGFTKRQDAVRRA
jgi:hypothetical protein